MTAFELFGVLKLDSSSFDKGLNQAKSVAGSVGNAIGGGLSKAASIGIGAMKAGIAAVGAASTAVGVLVTKSVQAYSDYEQLVGGVQKLYGNMGLSLEDYAKQQGKTSEEIRSDWQRNEEAAKLMMTQANNAFKTAGMSANTYMETATSFSASLIKSLNGDTLEAAKMTDKAMTAISDNWNTFGGDIGMIQGAFQGFAKQNYTMLDNLKLGYGGTKEEMQNLIKDANEYAKSIGQASNLSIDSFADIVTAIDLIQQKQQIAGTTAREASTTIQGSLGMVKAAWENLITGMADKEADLDSLMNNLVDAVAGYTDQTGQHVNGLIDNILPVAEKALESVSVLIEKLGPKIAEMIPELVTKVLPNLLSAGAQIVSSFADALIENLPQLLFAAGDMIETLLDGLVDATANGQSTLMEVINFIVGVFEENYMTFIDQGLEILLNIIEGIMNGIPEFLSYASEIITHFAEALIEYLPLLAEAGIEIMGMLIDSIAENIDQIINLGMELIEKLVDAISKNLPKLAEGAKTIIEKLYSALIENLPKIMEFSKDMVLKLMGWITENAPQVISGAVEIITQLVNGLAQALPELIPAALEMILTIVEGLLDNIDKVIDSGIQLIIGLAEGLINALPKLIEKAPVIIEKLVTAIINNVPKMITAAGELIGKLLVGIIQNLPKMIEAGMKIVTELCTGLIRFLFHIYDAGKQMVEKIGEGLKTINPIEWGKDMIDSFIKGIKDRVSKVKEAASDIAGTIKDILGFSEPEEGPLSDFHTFAPDMMNLFIKGVQDNTKKLQDQIEKSFDFGDAVINSSPNTAGIKTAGNTSNNNITLNVYGAEGQDVNELADIISARLLHQMGQTGAVYA